VRRNAQSGMTLVIALVMLVVLTLLVVSAVRFGNINLRIAGNVQSETEAAAAAQVAVESTIATMAASANISAIAASAPTISTGGKTYGVAVNAPNCVFSKQVTTDTLDPTKPADRVCFEGSDVDKLVTATGALSSSPSACKDQQWDVVASVANDPSGANLTMLQGAAVRVGAQVVCP